MVLVGVVGQCWREIHTTLVPTSHYFAKTHKRMPNLVEAEAEALLIIIREARLLRYRNHLQYKNEDKRKRRDRKLLGLFIGLGINDYLHLPSNKASWKTVSAMLTHYNDTLVLSESFR